MATNPVVSNLSVRAALDALLALLNVGGTAGTIQVRTGSPPATTLTADSGTLLATLTFSTTAFPASANDTLGNALATANAISPDVSIDATGTAGYFRAKSSAGTVILQGTCGTATADMILTTTSLVIGGQLACSSYTVTLPSGAASS